MRKLYQAIASAFFSALILISNSLFSQVSCPTGASNCELLPDITAGKQTLNSTTGYSQYSQLVTGLDRGLIRIDVATPNIGWGPLEVQSTNNYICGGDTLFNFFPAPTFLCPDGTYPKRLINQNIYKKAGANTIVEPRPAGWMEFHPAHGHIHIDGWGMYTIRLKDASIQDTLQWPIVNKGIKVSFCLIDLSTCSINFGDCVDAAGNVLVNTDFPNYGLGGTYSSCGDVKQGIGSGKVDVYHRSLDESFVKIPYEACNGNYFVMVEIDPDNHFREMNENNNWLAAEIPFTQQNLTGTGAYSYIFSKKGNTFCTGETMELEANGANSYLWSTGATSQKISVTQGGQYWVRTTTPCGQITSDTLVLAQKSSTTVPAITTTDTVCTGESAVLFASGNAKWYDAAVGGNLIHSGNILATGPLTSSTTYYVEDEPTTISNTLGPSNPFFFPGSFSTLNREFLVFNAFLPFRLTKVTVNAEVAGTRIIQLRNLYGKLIAEKQVSLIAGVQEIDLNFDVPSGMNHQLGLKSSSPMARLYINATGNPNIGYPFKVKSVANIVGSSLGNSAYPFFYNWKIETGLPTCLVRARKAVTAEVVARPVVTISGLANEYLHTDPPVVVSTNPPGGVLTGPSLISNSFYPRLSGVGTFNFLYSYPHPYCPAEATKTVIVKFNEDLMKDGFDIKLFNTAGGTPRLQVTTRENSPITVRLISSSGQTVQQLSLNASSGTNMYQLDLTKPAKDIYTLEVYHIVTGKRKILQLLN